MKRKKCGICGKGLCIYNDTGECYHHNDLWIDDHAPVTLCSSYDGEAVRKMKEFRNHQERKVISRGYL